MSTCTCTTGQCGHCDPGNQPAKPRYRVGRHLGRTVYDGDTLIGLMDTPELGALVVEALNRMETDGTD